MWYDGSPFFFDVESISTLPVKGEESLDNFNQKKER
tara:strand:+ start:723 stop:830 length:108 start_codon:yes stop_codon:yes gene_type:complete